MESESDAKIRALTELVKKEESGLARFAWRCLAMRGRKPTRQDVEDVLSEAYLTAATRFHREPSLAVANLRAWFYKVLFFKCLQHASKWKFENWNAVVDDLTFEDMTLDALTHEEYTAEGRLVRDVLLRELLEEASPEAQDILRLAAQGYTSQEIAERLKDTAANVRQRKARALAALRKKLLEE